MLKLDKSNKQQIFLQTESYHSLIRQNTVIDCREKSYLLITHTDNFEQTW